MDKKNKESKSLAKLRKMNPGLLERLGLSENFEVDENQLELIFEDNNEDEYKDVNISDLIPSVENKSIYLEVENESNFNALKQSIKETGLIHPIVCYQDQRSKKYTIISGHRRHAALIELSAEGHSQFNTTKVKVIKNRTKIDIMLTMLDANTCSREFSEYSKMMSVAKYAEIYQIKKKNKELPTGLTEKKFVSDRINIKERQVAKYLYMHNKLDPSLLKEVLNNNEMTLNKLYDRMQELKDEYQDISKVTSEQVLANEKLADVKDRHVDEVKISVKAKNKVKKFSKDISKVYDVGKEIAQFKEIDNQTKKQINSLLRKMENTLKELNPLLDAIENSEL